MSEPKLENGPRGDGAFIGTLDQETFRALLFNSFLHQQNRLRHSRREGERLAAVAATCRAVAQCADLRAALNLVAACAVEVTSATGAAIAVGALGQMTCWASSGATSPPLGAPVPLESGLSGECLRSRRTLRCDDTASDPRVNQEACARLGGVGSMLLVPLGRRQAAGILEVFATEPRVFNDGDEHVLEVLAVIAGAALGDFAESETAPRVSSRSLPVSVCTVPSQVAPA